MVLLNLLGLLTAVVSVTFAIFVFVSDCDFITLLCSWIGRKPKTFRGKIVWITGASSGIGEAIAKQLAEVGAKLVLSARRTTELERVKKECLRNSGLIDSDILVLPLDATNFESHEKSLEKVLDHFGTLDVFLSNAGQALYPATFVEGNMELDRHLFELNLFSIVNMNRLVVKYFLGKGDGQIAIMSSYGGKFSSPFGSSYAACKHALHGYFEALRVELCATNIDVTLICPGPVASPFSDKGMTSVRGEVAAFTVPKGIIMLSTERCAYLSLISMANRLPESWVSKFPFFPSSYMETYFPIVLHLCWKLFGERVLKYTKEGL